MNNITLFIHVLAAAALIGFLLPEIFIKRLYNETKDPSGKLALARLHLRMMVWGLPILLFIVFTGIGRTAEMHYPWFNFSLTFWLAAKQTLGAILLVWYLIVYSGIRAAGKSLKGSAESPDALCRIYERVRGKIHPIVMTALVLALLGTLKI
jgi:hypothetical protein